VRVGAGVQLDGQRAELAGAVDRMKVGTNEKTRPQPQRVEPSETVGDTAVVVRDVEPALGCDLFAPLWDERHLVRANSLGDREHFVGTGHLEVEDGRHGCGESLDVVVLNVAAIFAEVRGDAIGAGALADNGSVNRVRLHAAARLSQRRDVIDVDVEALPDHVMGLEARVSRCTHDDGDARVKKVIITAVLLAACSSSPSTPTRTTTAPAPVASGNQTGAPDPMAAIRAFLGAAKQQDIQSLGIFWGDAQGPARDRMERTEAEKRELIMVCYLKHDRYEIAGDAPNPGGTRAVVVNLTLGPLTRSANFQVVQGPGKRWYVADVDLKALQEFCARKSS